LSSIEYVTDEPANSFGFIVKSTELYIPAGDTVDVAAELVKLNAELVYTKGFLKSVMGKLSNERFVNSAPAQVVEVEIRKKADAEARIQVIQDQISRLSTS
jgi:valyl-tRNA synthetase